MGQTISCLNSSSKVNLVVIFQDFPGSNTARFFYNLLSVVYTLMGVKITLTPRIGTCISNVTKDD